MKKAQAALEFLTTYGWAFLVVLVMIGALSHFGVLNPSLTTSEKCISPQGFHCEEHKIQDTDQAFRFRNTLGETIQLQKTTIQINDETQDCMTDKDEVQPEEIFTVKCTSSETQKEQKTRAQIQINYYQDDPAYKKIATATVTTVSNKNTITPQNSVTFGTPEWKKLGELEYYAQLTNNIWKDADIPCEQEDCILEFSTVTKQYNSNHIVTTNAYSGRLRLNPQNLANYPAQQYCRSIGGQLPTVAQAKAILANYQLTMPSNPHHSNYTRIITSEYTYYTTYYGNGGASPTSGFYYNYVIKNTGNHDYPSNGGTQTEMSTTGLNGVLVTNSYALCVR